jgi:hypothetical protein
LAFVLSLALWQMTAVAHSGPPYPAVSGQAAGAYTVSVWTDPDTTDDRSPQGKFWVTLEPGKGLQTIDAATRVEVSIQARDRTVARESVQADLVKRDPVTFYAALLMDHEGPFAVHVVVDGPAGRATVDCDVQATYDLRPSRILMILYVAPFLAVAFLWGKLLRARRRAAVARKS